MFKLIHVIYTSVLCNIVISIDFYSFVLIYKSEYVSDTKQLIGDLRVVRNTVLYTTPI